LNLTKADKKVLKQALECARRDWYQRMLNARAGSMSKSPLDDPEADAKWAARREKQIAALDLAVQKLIDRGEIPPPISNGAR
jgi:hypothetical protein